MHLYCFYKEHEHTRMAKLFPLSSSVINFVSFSPFYFPLTLQNCDTNGTRRRLIVWSCYKGPSLRPSLLFPLQLEIRCRRWQTCKCVSISFRYGHFCWSQASWHCTLQSENSELQRHLGSCSIDFKCSSILETASFSETNRHWLSVRIFRVISCKMLSIPKIQWVTTALPINNWVWGCLTP